MQQQQQGVVNINRIAMTNRRTASAQQVALKCRLQQAREQDSTGINARLRICSDLVRTYCTLT
jgi:hypothetical protein